MIACTINLAIFFLLIQVNLLAQTPISKKDSIISRFDSLRIPQLDTLLKVPRIDSLAIVEVDKIELAIKQTNNKIDSLQALKLPTDKYEKKLDSINVSLRTKLNFSNKGDSLTQSIKGKLNRGQKTKDSIQQSLSLRLQGLQKKIDQKLSFRDSLNLGNNDLGLDMENPLKDMGVNLPSNLTSLPDVNSPNLLSTKPDLILPGANMPKLQAPDQLNKIGDQVNELQKVPKEKLNELGLANDLEKIKGKVAKAGELTEKAEQYKDEIKEIGKGNLEKVEALPNEIENAALQLDEVKGLQVEQQKFVATKNILQQYQEMAKKAMDTKELKDKAKETSKEKLVDLFDGKDEKLKAGIAQLDKLKKKYKSIPDSRYLPKHVPNEMKGKPFRERIVPGLGFQFYQADNAALDFSPYLSYKLSGRFRPGLGGTWRGSISTNNPSLHYDEVYSFRVFNDLRWRSNFYFHTEGEWLHFTESSLARYKFPVDQDLRLLKFRFNVGLLKTYTISKRFDGQVQFLYNLSDLTRFPQTKNVSLRFGFEYKLRTKK